MKFPVQIICSLSEIVIDEGVSFRLISDDEKFSYLGITAPEYDEKGRLIKAGPNSHGLIRLPSDIDPNLSINFSASNYFLEVKSIVQARNIKSTIKIYSKNSTSLLIGFVGDAYWAGAHYLHPPEFYGAGFLVLDDENLPRFRRIYRRVADAVQEGTKLSLVFEKYSYAVSSLGISNAHRFLECTIILEMIVLPSQQSELSYRFSLRMAKICRKYFGEDTQTAFDTAKIIYEIRCGLAHSGSHKKTEQMLPVVIELTRKLLLQYLYDQSQFTSKALDALSLE